MCIYGLPRWCSGKDPACNAGGAGDVTLTPGSGRPPGEAKDNAVQCSCLESSMDRRAWRATVHGVTERWTQLSNWAHVYLYMHFIHVYIKKLLSLTLGKKTLLKLSLSLHLHVTEHIYI